MAKQLVPGDRHYRAYVGYPETYDVVMASQFNLLTTNGMRERHSLLDIGCGSLRLGRLAMNYLAPGNYCGVEPNTWLLRDALKLDLGKAILKQRRPTLRAWSNFDFPKLGRQFDFLMAHSIFSHAAPHQIGMCLAKAKIVMKKGSKFFATYMQGEESYTGTTWRYPGCVCYRHADMIGFAEEAGLRMYAIHWPKSHDQTWVVFET